MRHLGWAAIAAALMLTATSAACAETKPVTAGEIDQLTEQVRTMMVQEKPLNNPLAEEAFSEDGYAWQFDFGVVYTERSSDAATAGINAYQLMDSETAGPRGISLDWEVNQVMEAVPCDNEEMKGTFQEALLYLEGSPEEAFCYGRVLRDGQRIAAIEYGSVDAKSGRRTAMILGISGDGVASIRVENSPEVLSAEDIAERYGEMEALSREYRYSRVPRSRNGADLEMFHEGDLDFTALSYRTAEPEIMGENVEDMLIDNDDGTWLRRVDGDGFEAVFTCDSRGKNARLVSYAILSPDLEGPRGVRLGDQFYEDFTRFRSGEGELDQQGLTEVLYGQVGTAPYGLAEYGDGTEMALRYVTPTLGGPDVELLLRYHDTVLSEIILHTLEEDES